MSAPAWALAGLSRIGVNRARVPAGKESFIYHSHHAEEEWIYIISGRGVAEIDGQEYEVAAGDFGGESHELEVADFPRLGKRMIRHGQSVEVYDTSDARSFGPLDD